MRDGVGLTRDLSGVTCRSMLSGTGRVCGPAVVTLKGRPRVSCRGVCGGIGRTLVGGYNGPRCRVSVRNAGCPLVYGFVSFEGGLSGMVGGCGLRSVSGVAGMLVRRVGGLGSPLLGCCVRGSGGDGLTDSCRLCMRDGRVSGPRSFRVW